MRRQLLFILLFTCSFTALAGGEREVIYNAYISNDMASWKRTIEAMNAEEGKSPDRELELLVQIAALYEELGNIATAAAFYQRALSIAPAFSWVKNELYPAFIKKHNIQ